jgi:hypothetical protein
MMKCSDYDFFFVEPNPRIRINVAMRMVGKRRNPKKDDSIPIMTVAITERIIILISQVLKSFCILSKKDMARSFK